MSLSTSTVPTRLLQGIPYQMPNAGGHLVGKYCGRYEPSGFTYSIHEVKLFIRSDLAFEQNGFKVSFNPGQLSLEVFIVLLL